MMFFKRLLLSAFLLALVSSASASCNSFNQWIQDKSSDGSIVMLSDGSVWEIDLIDRINSILWLPVENVITCNDALINLRSGDKVGARQLR